MNKRYELRFEHCIEDNEKHNTFSCHDRITVCKILNEQDEKIKELQSQVAKWKHDYENCCKLVNNAIEDCKLWEGDK